MASRSDVHWCWEAASARLATVSDVARLLVAVLLVAACGDRAPPPLWPEPPPPTLAKPIGQKAGSPDADGAESDDDAETTAGAAGDREPGRRDASAEPPSDPESGAVAIDGPDDSFFPRS